MDRNILLRILLTLWKGQARKSLWIETWQPVQEAEELYGQARKSLWIETGGITLNVAGKVGQARKSLWIETIRT